MRALVTGASGFSGAHLVRALERNGHQAVGLVRPSSNLDRLADCQPELVRGDITDRQTLEAAMQGADAVFHLAAYVELGLADEAAMTRTNVTGTQQVLAAARATGVPQVVYCSTIGVLGDTGGRIADETFQRTQAGFSSAYDRTKYRAQQQVDAFAADGLPAVSVLPAGILGPGDPHFGPIVRQFRQGKLRVWAGGDRPTGIVHVADLAAAMLLAAERGTPGERYILSAGELTPRQMFELLGKRWGIAPPREMPEPLVRLAGNLLDPLGRALGWQPPLSRERVHYIYDRCVRVDASKARQQLGWQPRSPEATVQQIAAALD